jgi:hypothetical protein
LTCCGLYVAAPPIDRQGPVAKKKAQQAV